jgi:hypothetical protein
MRRGWSCVCTPVSWLLLVTAAMLARAAATHAACKQSGGPSIADDAWSRTHMCTTYMHDSDCLAEPAGRVLCPPSPSRTL